jgi:hypothetical protein
LKTPEERLQAATALITNASPLCCVLRPCSAKGGTITLWAGSPSLVCVRHRLTALHALRPVMGRQFFKNWGAKDGRRGRQSQHDQDDDERSIASTGDSAPTAAPSLTGALTPSGPAPSPNRRPSSAVLSRPPERQPTQPFASQQPLDRPQGTPTAHAQTPVSYALSVATASGYETAQPSQIHPPQLNPDGDAPSSFTTFPWPFPAYPIDPALFYAFVQAPLPPPAPVTVTGAGDVSPITSSTTLPHNHHKSPLGVRQG